MAKRVVRAALWEYRDAKGQRRRAFFGQEVDVPASEIERGEAQGVFGSADLPDDAVIEHTPAPEQSGGPAPVPPHDVTGSVDLPEHEPEPWPILAPIEQSAVGGAQPEIVKTEAVTEPGAVERPKTAQSVDVWRDYVRTVRPDLADKVDDMTKDELRAAVKPKGE
ncbi:uncharacterized protein RMCC_1388 [Mycolicibacterium canariasense]|uniref:Uncharacterized protein n=1 Tax=Mycolicibacterium canariasense TaxID=228230 RepID=A0A100WA16_MYCCR|nr:hypothetical protein [Mycolicibacterium canariasense]MCV7208791.1 hypothetical protein [Mycolicibacterium canariasense]ORV07142.1 hypothetical protein AWB94_14165 [Mycolicibacterium canariasense]GAS94422.1 uncharacterized protein RMCC_1388 [Mycolicibacterium canariasense]